MSIANYLTALDAQRDQLARNLVTMGVQASESEKLNTLVPKVLQIPSGRPARINASTGKHKGVKISSSVSIAAASAVSGIMIFRSVRSARIVAKRNCIRSVPYRSRWRAVKSGKINKIRVRPRSI